MLFGLWFILYWWLFLIIQPSAWVTIEEECFLHVPWLSRGIWQVTIWNYVGLYGPFIWSSRGLLKVLSAVTYFKFLYISHLFWRIGFHLGMEQKHVEGKCRQHSHGIQFKIVYFSISSNATSTFPFPSLMLETCFYFKRASLVLIWR